MSHAELPSTYHYAAIAYLPGGRQEFPQDRINQLRLTQLAPSTFRRRPQEAK